MAEWVQKDMSGSLFVNDRKETDRHPDWKGTALIDGVEYWVSGWNKDGRNGGFQSLSFQKKEPRGHDGQPGQSQQSRPQQQQRPTPQRQPEPEPDYGSDGGEVPF